MLLLKNPHKVPPGGIQFCQPEVGWCAPMPLVDTVGMLARKVRALRQQSPTLIRLRLPTSLDVIQQEILRYNYRLRPDAFINTDVTAPKQAALVQRSIVKQSSCCGGLPQ